MGSPESGEAGTLTFVLNDSMSLMDTVPYGHERFKSRFDFFRSYRRQTAERRETVGVYVRKHE